MHEDMLKKIEQNEETVGILGLGYVGLPLAVTFALKNVKVVGFEKSEAKVEQLLSGKNYIADVEDSDLQKVVKAGTFTATTDFSRLSECDAIIICVPTPLDKFKKPDMRFIETACRDIGTHMRKGVFISLESTTYPTTTENLMKPIIEETSGMVCGEDFWLAFSPERVDPGNKEYKTANTPKVIGALTPEGLEIGQAVYGKAIENLYPVSSPRVAEMVKILENTYRLINISLINELALLSGKMDINIWEVIEAAKTKPYGFQAFYPGPGVGGHCIPLDPFYLEYIAKNYQFDLTMIHTAGHIDNLMPHRMLIKINTALNRQKKPVNGSKILFLGVAYKPNIADERESPALKVMDEVCKKGGEVSFCDPYIETVQTPEERSFKRLEYNAQSLQDADCVVITTNHSDFDADFITSNSKLVVDLRNVISEASDKVYKL
jgi:UDP-N-acetyl-D-glucosamine dehydrogenase